MTSLLDTGLGIVAAGCGGFVYGIYEQSGSLGIHSSVCLAALLTILVGCGCVLISIRRNKRTHQGTVPPARPPPEGSTKVRMQTTGTDQDTHESVRPYNVTTEDRSS